MSQHRRSSDFTKFRELFENSKRIVALTGAGVSAECGVPTFRGPGGFWRAYQATSLATPQAFAADPSLVWQFYEYRRQLVATKLPNNAHKTLAYIERQFEGSDRKLSIVTQNVDELHRRAGSKNVLEIHGRLFQIRCTKCHTVEDNTDNPIVPALANVSPIDNDETKNKKIKIEDLPHCKVPSCKALQRPHIVWFNESLDPQVLEEADRLLSECDMLLVIGTSSIVYPAAMFAPQVAARGVTVAEFNLEPTSASRTNGYFFEGPCGQTLPRALGVDENKL
ncbi:PREDICTED: NAD-dependent protein deacylase sirtuin-5, mitochondrial-like [Rhagoletis zephyria]|uniref:NAD-dependent protein deacylase sirtuin-5, mitochondrial-like n=1 Tax=Rhagoletis zephyria TaxID=28612 RepID=UPI000811A326|nr:PREDICTED: NAD-dependent protein deacylase sirtuin-5, mitochondrial-like [Rhagoletis zephyria]